MIKFLSEAYTLQEDITRDWKTGTAGELVVRIQDLKILQEKSKWYFDKKKQQQFIIFPMHTLVYPRLDVMVVKYVHDIPKNVCNRIQTKKSLQIHPICFNDSDHNYILK